MKEKMKLPIITAASLFALSFFVLISGTYAWYVNAKYVFVEDLTFEIQGGDGIEIGLKAPENKIDELKEAYQTDGVWEDDIFYISKENKVVEQTLLDFQYLKKDEKLQPVTIDGSKKEYAENEWPLFYKMPNPSNPNTLIVSKDGYYQFPFYFRSANRDINLYLDCQTSLKADKEKNKETAKKMGDLSKEEELNQIENYMRFSILTKDTFKMYEPNAQKENYSGTRLFGRVDLDGNGYYDVDDEKKEICYGQVQNLDKLVYADNKGEQISSTEEFVSKTYKDYYALDIESSLQNGLEGVYEVCEFLEDQTSSSITQNDENLKLATLTRDIPTEVVVSIWAEGWDLDCQASSQSASFLMDLVFSGKYPYGK